MSITEFISQFQQGARPNRFRVQITWPGIVGAPNVRDEIVIQAASLPPSNMGVVNVPYKGRQVPIQGDRTFEPWLITVLNDTTFSHRNAFERWSDLANGHESNLQATQSWKALVATIDVVQLDRDDNELKRIKIYNAWPQIIGEIALGYDQNDAIETFPVTLAYSHWEAANVTS